MRQATEGGIFTLEVMCVSTIHFFIQIFADSLSLVYEYTWFIVYSYCTCLLNKTVDEEETDEGGLKPKKD